MVSEELVDSARLGEEHLNGIQKAWEKLARAEINNQTPHMMANRHC